MILMALIAVGMLVNLTSGLVLGKMWLRNRSILRGEPMFLSLVSAQLVGLALLTATLVVLNQR